MFHTTTDAAMMGFVGAFLGVFLLIMLVVYVYSSLALMTIAKRTKTPMPWLAWIPIANLYLTTQIAKVPWWTMFAIFLPIVPIIGQLALLGVVVWWWWNIAGRLKKPEWMGILMIIPVVNFVVMGILAWGD